MNIIVSEANLKAGIDLLRMQKPKWLVDFGDYRYLELKQLKANGLSEQWWQKIVSLLWDWRAIRPFSKGTILRNGLSSLPLLQAEYDRIERVSGGMEPSLETASWETLAQLYVDASAIKRNKFPSPVFGSKLCHFILPNAFPVIDQEVVGVRGEYREYWNKCRDYWIDCRIKETLKTYLRDEFRIKATAEYPFSTKITELCIIGAKG